MPKLEEVNCPLCGSNECKRKAAIRLSPVRVRSFLVQCNQCGLSYVSPRPAQEVEKEFYQQEHYELEDEAAWRDHRLPIFEKALQEIERKTNGRILLDIGCGGGFFLELAEKRGWKAKGIEISEGAFARARKLGLNVVQGEISEFADSERFNAITLWNVLDQVMNPKEQLQKIYSLLEPGGFLALRISNLTFHLNMHRLWSFLENSKVIPKDESRPTVFHLQMFSGKTIHNALKKTGFQSIEVKNSLLDSKNRVLSKLFGPGSTLAASGVFHLAEGIRLLTLNQIILGPSLVVYAHKGL